MYNLGGDLDGAIEDAIDGFRDEREQVWREDDEGRRALRIADRIAELLHIASQQLSSPVAGSDSDDWRFVRELATNTHLWPVVKERLQIDLAWKIAPRTAAMADRCLDITRVIFDSEPGERVLKYVRRLTSCYVAGFFPECVVLARAVVERALKDTFERKRVPLPATTSGASAMKRLIDEAYRHGWLGRAAQKAAHTVRLRGNKAVHEDPELVEEVRDTVHGAIDVIRELMSVS